MAPTSVRPLRADARRNREAILGAARAVFEVDGILAPLDGIATAAGVGNATLYRHFPTRDDLLAAVIEESIDEVLSEAAELERSKPAVDALREWLHLLAWRLRIWNDLPTCIAGAIDDDSSPIEDVTTRLTNRTRSLLRRAQDDGTAASSVTVEDLVELITAVSWAIDRFGDDPARAHRRMDLASAGVFQTPEVRSPSP
jgi:AcrR family transcriptional regulator